MEEEVKRPYPGSKEAADQGCICATIDNHYGKGRGGDGHRWGWYITGGCPLHDDEVVIRIP